MLRDYIELPLPVRILCVGSLLNRAGSFVVVFLAIYASEQLGYGVPFATACMGILGAGSLAGALLGGHLADQWGRRIVMLIALFGGAAMLLVLSLQTNRWGFMVCVGLFALVTDMYRPAASAMIADLVPIDRRAHAFALMYISINLGFAIAPPIGGLLAEVSYDWLFWGDALTMALYGAIIIGMIRETLGTLTSTEPQSDVQGDSTRESKGKDRSAISIRVAMRHVTSDSAFILFCASTLISAIVFVQGFSTLPIYIRQSGFSHFQFGLLMSINGVLIVALQLPMTHWLSRFNAMSVIVVGGLLISVGYGLTSLATGFLFLGITICVWTLGEILQAPFTQAVVTDLAPVRLRARYMGLFSTCHAIALMIGAPIGGEILSRYGPTVLWGFMAALALVAVLGYGSIRGRVTRRQVEVKLSG